MFNYSNYQSNANFDYDRQDIPDGTILAVHIDLKKPAAEDVIPGKSPYLYRSKSGLIGFTMILQPVGTKKKETAYGNVRFWQWFPVPVEDQAPDINLNQRSMIERFNGQLRAIFESGMMSSSFEDVSYLNGKMFLCQISAKPGTYKKQVRNEYGEMEEVETPTTRYNIQRVLLPKDDAFKWILQWGELTPRQQFAVQSGRNPNDPEFAEPSARPVQQAAPQQDVEYYQNQTDDPYNTAPDGGDNVPF